MVSHLASSVSVLTSFIFILHKDKDSCEAGQYIAGQGKADYQSLEAISLYYGRHQRRNVQKKLKKPTETALVSATGLVPGTQGEYLHAPCS